MICRSFALLQARVRSLSPDIYDTGMAVLDADSAFRVLEEWIADVEQTEHVETCDRIRAYDVTTVR